MEKLSHLNTRMISIMESIARSEGISPNAGKILGYLIMSAAPVPFGDLAQRLKISRGSVSENTRLLIEQGVIERVAVPESRKDHYRVRDDAHTSLLERRRRLTQEVITDLRDLQKDLPRISFQRDRLEGVEQFLSASLIAADVLEAQYDMAKNGMKAEASA